MPALPYSWLSLAPLAVLVPGCDHPEPDTSRAGIACTRLEEVFALEHDQVDQCTGFLLVEQEIDPALEIGPLRRRVDGIARRYLDGDRTESLEQRVRRLLLNVGAHAAPEGTLEYEVETRTLREVLEEGRGNCLSLSAVHAAVAERVGLEARFMLAPYHVYVRCVDGDQWLDVETTNGSYFPDGRPDTGFFFSERDRASPEFQRPLRPAEAVAMYTLEHALRIEARDPDRALELVEAACAALPWSSRGPTRLAELLFDRDPERAREAFEEAIRLRPDDGDLWNSLAALHLSRGRPDEALEALERATWLDGNFAVYWINVAMAHMQLDDDHRALEAMWRAWDAPFVRLPEARRMALGFNFEDQEALDREVARHLSRVFVRLAESALDSLSSPTDPDHAERHAEAGHWRLLATLAALAAGLEIEGAETALADGVAAEPGWEGVEGDRLRRLLALARGS